jgi:AmmeMemoRadiSam system protein B/AmmeMemoRadiSam system protein A
MIVAIVAVLLGPAGLSAQEAGIRRPAVAGSFYPERGESLRRAIQAFLAEARPAGTQTPIAIVAPHAGYVYSGQIAADAYASARAHDYDVIVILGTNHTSGRFSRVSIWPDGGYRTPLGVAKIEVEVAAELMARDDAFTFEPSVHTREHSVEVQVPFVQECFPETPILAAIVGRPDLELCERFGRALADVLRDRNALIVASADLSHYPGYEDANRVDRETLDALIRLDPGVLQETIRAQERAGVPGLSTCACGEAPILAMIFAARALGATRATVISYANSGDSVMGDHERVVGYGAVCVTSGSPEEFEKSKESGATEGEPGGASGGARLHEDTWPELGPADREWLLAFARESIRRAFETGVAPLPRDLAPALRRKQGAFVTLEKHGELRGCIGHMEADLPVTQVVGQMALAAAFSDRRFPPLRRSELDEIDIEISLLTPARPAPVDAIVIGRDGVVLEKNRRSAVFLPYVAVEQGWDLQQTLDRLCQKAGLGPGCWREGAELSTFQSEVFGEAPAHTP